MQEKKKQQEQPEFRGGQLTALSVQKASPDRLNVFVDDEFLMGVYREVALKHRLKKGLQVTVELLEAVWRDEVVYKAKEAAVHYLSFRHRSKKEMADYLSGKDLFDEAVVNMTLEWLVESGYLNDNDFARQWVENRMRSRPRGKAMLKWELKQKGIESDHIAEALDEVFDDELEVEGAIRLLEKKVGRKTLQFTFEEQRKLAQHLARRGFSSSVIKDALRRFISLANLDND
ncbi:regulatory protein [Tumebacillus sp. BK434]|uniref:regulatory protein RecX n=1 Tax=Tumebacillus sp. BK434 TaxID=2512169 RepID=UPI00104B05CF|nr:RecX family transcriptional regulator [Tumebacillus sp. BK434]TCP58916.1 regulatory protein [Tumebacillus sp. BK434]